MRSARGTIRPWIHGGSTPRAPREDIILIRWKDSGVLLSARGGGGNRLWELSFHILTPCCHCIFIFFLWSLAIEEWVSVRLDAREVLYYL